MLTTVHRSLTPRPQDDEASMAAVLGIDKETAAFMAHPHGSGSDSDSDHDANKP